MFENVVSLNSGPGFSLRSGFGSSGARPEWTNVCGYCVKKIQNVLDYCLNLLHVCPAFPPKTTRIRSANQASERPGPQPNESDVGNDAGKMATGEQKAGFGSGVKLRGGFVLEIIPTFTNSGKGTDATETRNTDTTTTATGTRRPRRRSPKQTELLTTERQGIRRSGKSVQTFEIFGVFHKR